MMKLAISNIAWTKDNDELMYDFLVKNNIDGLEIAPTRLFDEPYTKLEEANNYKLILADKYGLEVVSMQSILFNRSEQLFGGDEDRKNLVDYLKQAINFAESIGCNNLVFGSPKNRSYKDSDDLNLAIKFFKELGDYAKLHNTVLSIEANPSIYGTNYINTTSEAFVLCEEVNSSGFKVNVDLGTIITNNENVDVIIDNLELINHIHISEPHLVKITNRDIHKKLINRLVENNYQGYISIEMATLDNVDEVKDVITYVKELTELNEAVSYNNIEGVPNYEAYQFEDKNAKYCLCIPVINEGERIIKELQRANKANVHEIVDIVICDGGSTDGSLDEDMLRKLGVNTLLIKKDTGKLSAQLRMGYHYCLERGYAGIITVDGNNKDSIEDVSKFIDKLDEGYDLIQGSRFIKGGQAINTPLERHLAVKFLHAPMISLTAKQRFTDTTNGYRGYSRQYLLDERVGIFRDIFVTYELLVYLSVRATQLGYKAIEIPVTRMYPKTGKTPTKINGIKGKYELVKMLWKNYRGAYHE